MKKNLLFNIILVLLNSFHLYASISEDEYTYKMLLLTGNSPVHAGRGYTGVADNFYNSFFYNPAALAGEVSNSSAVNYGNLAGEYYYPSIIGIFPNQYFKSGFEYSALSWFDSRTIDTHILRFAAAESLNRFYDFGASVNYYHLNRFSSVSYFSVSLGGIYHADYTLQIGQNFGIYDLNAGAKVTPGFFVETENPDGYSSLATLDFGYNFVFFRNSNFKVKWYQETSALSEYFQLPFKQGFETELYTNYFFRTGFIYPDAYTFGSITLGAGYKAANEDFSGQVDYALVHRVHGEFVHYAGLSFSFSSSIRGKNDIVLLPLDYFFSPNDDRVKDLAIIQTRQYDNIGEWQFEILDSSENVVKSYNYLNINTGTIIDKVLSTESVNQLPERFVWDGTDDAGNIMPDGNYTAVLTIRTKNGRTIRKSTPKIVLDTKITEVSVFADKTLLSPETEYCRISHSLGEVPDATTTFTGRIVNTETNTEVLTFEWDHDALPKSFDWYGLNKDDEPVADGVYTYVISAEDSAGNRFQTSIERILVVSGLIKISVSTGKEYYGSSDSTVVFIPDVPQNTMVDTSVLYILKDNEIKYTMSDLNISSYPEFVIDANVPDGNYSYYLKVFYKTGDNPESNQKSFVIDRSPPAIKGLIIQNNKLSETSDFVFKPDVINLSPVANWQLRVVNGSVVLFQQNGRDNLPDQIEVNLKNDVAYGTEVEFLLTVRDKADNLHESIYSIYYDDLQNRNNTHYLIMPISDSDNRLSELRNSVEENFPEVNGILTVDIYSSDRIVAEKIADDLDGLFDSNAVVVTKLVDVNLSGSYLLIYFE
jgi:flagellar hook assembly protein FlgD